jgi:hypothetical protein
MHFQHNGKLSHIQTSSLFSLEPALVASILTDYYIHLSYFPKRASYKMKVRFRIVVISGVCLQAH